MGITLRGGLTQVKLIRTNAFAYYMFHMHVSYKFYYNNNREKLPKETPTSILEKYRNTFKIDENQDNSEVARYRERINQFNGFLCKAILGMNVRYTI